MPAQFAPPMADGKINVGSRPIGVNGPRCFSRSNISTQYSCDSGVTFDTSSRVIDKRASGGVTTGNGCVGHETSPGTVLCGTGRSSTGKSGLPVTRSSTYNNPDFEIS